MADAKVSTVTAELLADVLRRAVTTEQDLALLQATGWLKATGWLTEKESSAGGATAENPPANSLLSKGFRTSKKEPI